MAVARSTRPPGLPRHLPSLTGVRFLACLVVFAAHALDAPRLFADPKLQRFFGEMASTGTVAVTLFFLLSGFVMTWTARPGEPARRFWRRRLVRVVPNHVLCLAAAAVLVAACGVGTQLSVGDGPWHPGAVLANLFLVHVWVPSGDFIVAANPVTWSMACEVLFYLLFPVLIRWVRAIPRARLGAWTLAMVAAAASVPCVAQWLLPAPAPVPGMPQISLEQYWLAYVFPVSRLPEFLIGMLLARLIAEGWRPPRLRHVAALPFVTVLLTLQMPAVFTFGPLSAGPVALVVAALAHRDLLGRGRWLSSDWMVAAGERTYACYLSHYVVIMYVTQLVAGPGAAYATPVALGYVLLMAALTLAATWALYRFVERPAMERWARPRRPATGAAVPAPAAEPASSTAAQSR
ncbi:acyltransferase family protein [Streptomyces sp. NPDC127098]|uniref:acyltransferase family protein n=1 Tax=Streptomyces sp. NPDC127098 TaxID=3347137 RepID=UPI00364C596F